MVNAPKLIERPMHQIKQVLLIRKDLAMRRGKEIAQGSHASLAFLSEQIIKSLKDGGPVIVGLDEAARKWLTTGPTKVCLQVRSEDQLVDCHKTTLALGLKSHLVRDAGHTEFGGVSTLTACAIGPDYSHVIDQVTGGLQRY